MKVTIQSATSLTLAQKKQLSAKLKQELGPEAKAVYQVEPSLIGGLRILGPSKVIDLSIKSRLTQLKQNVLS